MNKLYMGIDIGSTSVKGVIIDEYDNIITSSYLNINGEPIDKCKQVILNMREDIDLNRYQVVSVGVTGIMRKLVGTMLGATTVKNEIMAEAIGTSKLYPNVRTIFSIGGQDAKIILVTNGVVSDYSVNSLCASGTGSFIESLIDRLDVKIDDVSSVALSSNNIANIHSKCAVFAYGDMNNKIRSGYKKEDIIAGLCMSVSRNFVSDVCHGKKIISPIVFNGGVSKNRAIVKYLSDILNEKIIVDKNSHLIGAFGIAVMARESKKENIFDFNIEDINVETKIKTCNECSDNCEIIMVYRNNQLLDYWGCHCDGVSVVKKNVG